MGRDPKHDYRGRSIYYITIGKSPHCPNFCQISGSPDQPVVNKSAIGSIIERQILNFPNLCPALQILQYAIMPDHIHFAIFAREYLQRAIGSYIGMMKVKIGQIIREAFPQISDIFTPDFHDRYLLPTLPYCRAEKPSSTSIPWQNQSLCLITCFSQSQYRIIPRRGRQIRRRLSCLGAECRTDRPERD